jgi:hypothetical protein
MQWTVRTALPLTTILAATKFFPVPDASTCTVLIDLEPSAPLKSSNISRPLARNMCVDDCAHALKSVMLGEKVPAASA